MALWRLSCGRADSNSTFLVCSWCGHPCCALEMHSELESQSNQNLQQVAVEQNNSYHLLSKNNWSLKTVDLESIVSFQRSTF